MGLPKPPVRNMTDFVVFCFVSIVAAILLGAVIVVAVVEIRDPTTDTTGITGALADIVTTLIGALVGFIAGKGQGHTEAREQIDRENQIQQIQSAQATQASRRRAQPKDGSV